MSKKSSKPTELIENEKERQIVVQVKPMTMQEKSRIEKLVDTRTESLRSYLNEMKMFALEANENTVSEYCLEIENLEKERVQIAVDHERIRDLKKDEVTAVNRVIDDAHERKMLRLKLIQQKLLEKVNATKEAAQQEIRKKFSKTEDTILQRELEINSKLEEIKKLEKREKLVRKIALTNSFSQMEDGIADARNHAVEKLYTEVVETTQAKAVLAYIPDAILFRKQVSPERLFQVFNSRIEGESLPLDKMVCSYCNSDEIVHYSRGEIYCRKCGRHDVLGKEIKELAPLPTLEEVLESKETDDVKQTTD